MQNDVSPAEKDYLKKDQPHFPARNVPQQLVDVAAAENKVSATPVEAADSQDHKKIWRHKTHG